MSSKLNPRSFLIKPRPCKILSKESTKTLCRSGWVLTLDYDIKNPGEHKVISDPDMVTTEKR